VVAAGVAAEEEGVITEVVELASGVADAVAAVVGVVLLGVAALWFLATTKTAMSTTPTITVKTTREEDLGAGAVALEAVGLVAGTGDEAARTGVAAGFTALAGVDVETAGITTAAADETFFAGAFVATFFAGAFVATFFAGAFLATTFLATTFLATTFLATTFLATTFLATTFLATTFLAGAFLAATFFAATFFAATFFAGAFLAADFLAVFLTATGDSSVKCDRS